MFDIKTMNNKRSHFNIIIIFFYEQYTKMFLSSINYNIIIYTKDCLKIIFSSFINAICCKSGRNFHVLMCRYRNTSYILGLSSVEKILHYLHFVALTGQTLSISRLIYQNIAKLDTIFVV